MRGARWRALGTDVHLLVLDDGALPAAEALLRADLDAVDAACSRFRADSELRRLRPGRQRVSPLLGEAVAAALQAAEETGGLVDPTLGRALEALGYDRTLRDLPDDGPAAVPAPPHPSRWRELRADGCVLDLPEGVLLDLGASGKSWAADRSAQRLAARLGTGVLVNLGGDLAVAGPLPGDGWPVDAAGQRVLVTTALATSSTRRRTWRRGGVLLHHVLDPRTGLPARTPWTTVSVVAETALRAGAASTAALVLGPAAPSWLARRGLPARLVAADGQVHRVAGWPADERVAA